MNSVQPDAASSGVRRRGFSGKQVLLFVLLAILLTAAVTFWFIRSYVYARDFEPVQLDVAEQTLLDTKLAGLGLNPVDVMPHGQRAQSEDKLDADGRLIPEQYSEVGASRDIRLSEKELNAMLASNPDLARRFAVDLSSNLASGKLLIPVDPDFPIMGGKTLRVSAGLELDYQAERPVVILRGVSVMGVPIPNAWLGNLKNVDLVRQFGGESGFWRSFADGVESITIEDGSLHIQLKE